MYHITQIGPFPKEQNLDQERKKKITFHYTKSQALNKIKIKTLETGYNR